MSGLEADPRRDEAMRAVAGAVVGDLLEQLSDPRLAQEALFAIHESGGMLYVFNRETDADMLAALKIDPEDFPKQLRFNIVLAQMLPGHQPAAWNGAANTMTLYMLPPDVKERIREDGGKFWNELLDNISRGGTFIVHEAIHMLDQARGNPRLLKPPSYGSLPEGSARFKRAYFESPEEQNAFFQSAITEIDIYLDSLSPAQREHALSSFEIFTRYMANHSESYRALQKHSRPKAKRKIAVRLWQSYTRMRGEN